MALTRQSTQTQSFLGATDAAGSSLYSVNASGCMGFDGFTDYVNNHATMGYGVEHNVSEYAGRSAAANATYQWYQAGSYAGGMFAFASLNETRSAYESYTATRSFSLSAQRLIDPS